LWVMGFESPLKKQSGGLLLGRGRILSQPEASRKVVSTAAKSLSLPSAIAEGSFYGLVVRDSKD